MTDKAILKNLAFNKPWRSYQQRILDIMDFHLSDGKLHVVAAPGAGKTILGLEAFRRLGKPAVALSPTRNIRDQWILRLRDFISEDTDWPLSWTSSNLKKPGYFTSITYQALHSAYINTDEQEYCYGGDDNQDYQNNTDEYPDNGPPTGEEVEGIISQLKNANIGTLILDEAHHLRSEWWKALRKIIEGLKDITLISLTATPPYDVIGSEWDKYIELCGPIDEQISVPELVKDGTLCPHQDYLWMVEPSESDKTFLRRHNQSVEKLFDDLLNDKIYLKNIKTHPWISSPDVAPEDMLDNPELVFGLLVYLKAVNEELPENILILMDTKEQDIPVINRRWWQILVKAYLFDDSWPSSDELINHREQLAKRLRAESLLWRRELRLDESNPVKKKLSLSPAKLDGCLEIYKKEAAFRGAELRQVILTDFICENEEGYNNTDTPVPLGSYTVFMKLIKNLPSHENKFIAMLTGSVTVLHESLLPYLKNLVNGEGLNISLIGSAPGFLRIAPKNSPLTESFTSLLTEGKLRVLVGTRSLLGEGWDAPVVNSLILCSFVGTSMITNQMRGRAIRASKSCLEKSSSIWHLLAADKKTPFGLSDIYDLERRFSTFSGLSKKDHVIESGLNRMGLDFYQKGMIIPAAIDLDKNNQQAVEQLLLSSSLSNQWHMAIDKGVEKRVIPVIHTSNPPRVKTFHFVQTIKYLFFQVLYLFIYMLSDFMSAARNAKDYKSFLWLMGIGVTAAFLFTLPKFVKALIILIRHLPVDGSLRQIALALRDGLCASRIFEDPPEKLSVVTKEMKDGSFFISLSNASFYQESLFTDCLDEILGPVENPRYLITRHSITRKMGKVDYHAVPSLLGAKKEFAELFLNAWHKRVGQGELIYTRSKESRRLLLKARAKAFSSVMSNTSERLDRWQ